MNRFITARAPALAQPLALAVAMAAAGAAPALAQTGAAPIVTPEVIARDLQNPWGLAFIGEGRMLVTERPGRMRVVEADGRLGPPLKGLPEIDAVGQGGLLDVTTDRDFARNRTVHFCYSEPGLGGNSTAMASARLADDRTRLEDLRVVFSQKPKVGSRLHFGCRIVQTDDGGLFLALGDRYSRMQDAQTLDNHQGKLVRVMPDGQPHPANPFLQRSGARPEIYSLGHRNIQGATLAADGTLWTIEHGPQGGDELNRPEAGKNYGWPVITYGENYGGGRIGAGITRRDGMEQPVQYWVPSIAPSGLVFLGSDRYGAAWKGSLFTGSLKFRQLVRLQLEGGRVVKEERLLGDLNQRIRDVREGPDGLLYLLTDDSNGQLIRLRPR
jgi:glucose/arabinose dehydrogenase